MDSLMQIKGIVEDFNFLCDKNKSWVDDVLLSAKHNSIMNAKYIVPRTPLYGKKLHFDELKSSDQGYESFRNSSQNCSSRGFKSYTSSIIPTPRKYKQCVGTQTDPVIIFNKEDCENLQKICKNFCRKMSVELSRSDFSDEGISSLSDVTSTPLDKNVTTFISIFATSINEGRELCLAESVMATPQDCEQALPPTDVAPNFPSFEFKPSIPESNLTTCEEQGSLGVCNEDRMVDDLMARDESNKACNQPPDIPIKPTNTASINVPLNSYIKRPEVNTFLKPPSKVNGKILSNEGKSVKESETKHVGLKSTPTKKRRSSRVIVKKSLLSTNNNKRRSSVAHFDKKNNLFCSARWKFFGAKKKTAEVSAGNIVKESSRIEKAPFRETSNSGLSSKESLTSKESFTSAIPRMPSKSRINHLQRLFASRTRTDLDKIASDPKPLTNLPVPSVKLKNANYARSNTLVKCISGRRSSIVDSFGGSKQFLRQEPSIHHKHLYKPLDKLNAIPCKTPISSKSRKEELVKVGPKSVPVKNYSNEYSKKPVQNEAINCLLPNSSLKPTRMTFLRCESPCETYDISDLNSDDEGTSNARKIRKRIPSWASGKQLIGSLMKFQLNPVDVEEIFGTIFAPDLNDMFLKKKSRFDNRTSSANWEVPLTMAPGFRC